MNRWNTTYTILIASNGLECSYTDKNKDVLLRVQHLSGSYRKFQTIVHPSRWSRKPGLLESLQNRTDKWLIKNAIDKDNTVFAFPAVVSNSKREQIIFLALSQEDINRFHPTIV